VVGKRFPLYRGGQGVFCGIRGPERPLTTTQSEQADAENNSAGEAEKEAFSLTPKFLTKSSLCYGKKVSKLKLNSYLCRHQPMSLKGANVNGKCAKMVRVGFVKLKILFLGFCKTF